MILQFFPWQNFRQVHRLLLFQMIAHLVMQMMAHSTLQGVAGASSAVLTRFLERCPRSCRDGGIRRWDLPSLHSPRRHLLVRLEAGKAFHLSPPRGLNSPMPVPPNPSQIHKSPPDARYEISSPSTSLLLQPRRLFKDEESNSASPFSSLAARSCNQVIDFYHSLREKNVGGDAIGQRAQHFLRAFAEVSVLGQE